MTDLKQRYEIVFLYDVKDANPNGDPDDGNRPRTDHRGYNIVTDVRLKRTIRDYWHAKYQDKNGCEVLVRREEKVEDGTVKSMASLITGALNLPDEISKKDSGATTQKIRMEVPSKFLDARTFGAAITLARANVSLTGPVQFGIGRSLNRPRITTHTITTTFSSTDDKTAGTFGETHVIDYSLLCFGGIISETTAIDTGFNSKDLEYLWDGLWNGTKHINTRSKFNHVPRLLIAVVSKEGEFQIGGLYRKLQLALDKENEEKRISSEKEVNIDLNEFMVSLMKFSEDIDKVLIKEDETLTYSYDGKTGQSITKFIEEVGLIVQEIE